MSRTVLLVDDDKNSMNFVVDVIENTGEFKVIWLKSADELLEKIGTIDFDLLVLDIMMFWGKKYTSQETEGGFKTGLSLFKDLFLSGEKKPIIVLTLLTGAKNQEARQYFEAHPDRVKAFLNKPTSAVQLRNIIRSTLADRE